MNSAGGRQGPCASDVTGSGNSGTICGPMPGPHIVWDRSRCVSGWSGIVAP